MAPKREFTSEQILGAHVGFLRLMVEAMAPATLPARSEPINIAVEARTVRLALQDILSAASQPTLAALTEAVERIRPLRCADDPAFGRRVLDAQRRILASSKQGVRRQSAVDLKVEVVALWTLVTALITTAASEDRLLTARATAERGLAALGGGEDDPTHLSIRVQVDFYDTCLDAFHKSGSAISLH